MRLAKNPLLIISLIVLLTGIVGCGDDDSPTSPTNNSPLMSFDFAEDAQGWGFGTSSIDWGKAQRASKSKGIMELDGVGNNDPGPNAWAWRQIDLPAEARTFRFLTSAHDRGDGTGFLRVRVRAGANNWQEFLALEEMATGAEGYEWEERSLDISSFAGQSVMIQFELEDSDGGGNNQRYVDDIEIS